MRKIKLFCLPYAGGMASMFRDWKKYLDNSIQIIPVEYAGRGMRYSTPFYQSMDDAVEDVLAIMQKHISGYPYAILGHSLGALIAFEVAHKIMENNLPEPMHVFFSAHEAPEVKNIKVIHNLSYEDFLNEIISLGGIPEELIAHKELLDIFIPVLRADYKISESYVYRERNNKLNIPVTVLKSQNDIPQEQLTGWSNVSNAECSFYTFEGSHFFIYENAKSVIDVVNNTLKII